MTTNRAYRAMEFIGDDLIERAEIYFGAKARRPAALWTKGIAVAASISLIAGGTYYTGMWYWNGTDRNDTIQSDSTKKPVLTEPDAASAILTHTFDRFFCYIEGRTAFAKLKIEEIDESEYRADGDDGWPCMLIKCTVMEDYYDTIESGAQVTLMVMLCMKRNEFNEREYMERQLIVDFLTRFDYLFAFIEPPQSQCLYSVEADAERDDFYVARKVQLDMYDIIPISDGKLALNALKEFCDGFGLFRYEDSYFSEKNFWSYIQDGMDESDFAENIRENKERQIQKSS